MRRRGWFALAVVLVAITVVSGRDAAADQLRDAIAAQLTARAGGKARAADREVLRSFYAEHAHAPLWLDGAEPNARGRALMDALSHAADEGLAPRGYGLPASLARRTAQGPADAAALELSLSRALLLYARAVRVGQVPPRIRYHGVTPVALDLTAILHRAAAATDIRAFIADLAPKAPAYRRLRAALKRYRTIAAAGGWPRVPVIKGLTVGQSAPGVTALRRRLAATGDLKSSAAGTAVFDRDLWAALRRFQARHGLAKTGRVGAFTRAALNVSVNARIATIVLNLERLRWIPDWHADRVVVNAAAFRLRAIRRGKVKLTSAVIVGACHQPTPQFVTWMTGVQFNPYWYVPASIAAREILPRLRRDPGYLRRNGMTVLTRKGKPVDPRAVDWKALKHMPYRLRQRPGPGNALGRIRFLMPNPHNVYLHDTSSPKLFERRRRAFSHGCIRVARPADLAAFLLEGQPGWDLAAVRRAAAASAQRKVLVDRPIPVFIAYYTAWVAADGSVQFREDLYRRDRRLAAALRRRN